MILKIALLICSGICLLISGIQMVRVLTGKSDGIVWGMALSGWAFVLATVVKELP